MLKSLLNDFLNFFFVLLQNDPLLTPDTLIYSKNIRGSILNEIGKKLMIRHQNLVMTKVIFQNSSEFNEIWYKSRTGHTWSTEIPPF